MSWLAGLIGLCLMSMSSWARAADPLPAVAADRPVFDEPAIEFFEKQVRPLLIERCFECHSDRSEKPAGGLRLDSRAALMRGGDTGPAVVAGKPADSLLIDAVNYGDLYEMPPKSKLPQADIDTLATWVRMGLPWPATEPAGGRAARAEFDLAGRRAGHWCWQPTKPQAPPAVKNASWPSGPIDNFVLARLESAGLAPASAADKRTLLRRACFDLTGLPPTRDQLESFLADESPEAFARIVDQLLASPHFGERWARHWLDLVRYAESRGHEFDYDAANAYQYRDYVIRALNDDIPYDQFVREHIAGDLLPQPRRHATEEFNESIIGTGFWFLGEWVHSPVDIRQDETDRIDNMIDTMTKTFLGLTVSCARCHDHKFDAISQRDYYAVAGFLQSSAYRQARIDSLEHNAEIARRLEQLRSDSRAEIAVALDRLHGPVLARAADYLLATREVVSATADGGAVADRIADAAGKRRIDSGLLTHWVDEIGGALKDPRHPLHAWACVAHDSEAERAERFAEIKDRIAGQLRADAERAAEARSRMRVIVDYQTAGPADWLQDGHAFGLGPIRAGQLLFGHDAQPPLVGVATYGAARRDPAFHGLTLAGGTQKEPGALGGWVRAGQTLRTPTFTIESGNLHYLVQGAGNVQAVVDSHRTIAGPLHGALVKRWAADAGQKPRWITHNLSTYVGHGVHVEFAPQDAADLQVLMVVEADKPPGDVTNEPNALLLEMLTGEQIGSIESLAAAYQECLTGVSRRLAADEIAGRPDAVDAAAIADSLVRSPQLFAAPESDARTAVQRLAEEHRAAERELTGQIRRQSRTVMAMWDGSGVNEHLLIRGNSKTPGDEIPRRLLEAIGGAEPVPVRHGSGRLELAGQMTDPQRNPLVARVLVNRVWHHLFGRGIVASVDNFGVLGQPPTHPELLDYLATQFVAEGWSIKRLIRTLVLSSTYRMASTPGGMGDELDPNNELLHRMRLRRLEGETIRDAILAVSGRLDRRLFGPPVPVYLTSFMQGRGRPGSGPLDGAGRRSIYISVRRNFLSPMMLVFDTPAPAGSVGRRNVSNVPAQALALMNDPMVVEQAGVWARRLLAQGGLSPAERVDEMYLDAFARPPTDRQQAAALAFLQSHGELLGAAAEQRATDPRVWADLCHVMFNVKEFIFVR